MDDLKINDWLELIKEDKNLNGAYISIAQYIYLIEKENKELKKQLDELNRFKFSCKKDETQIPTTVYNKKNIEDMSKIKNQQKEFIKYLEDEIENKGKKSTSLKAFERNVMPLKHALQKYKEIIGDDYEKLKRYTNTYFSA